MGHHSGDRLDPAHRRAVLPFEGESWVEVSADVRVEVSPNESIHLCAIGEDSEGLLRLNLVAQSELIGCTSGAPSPVNFTQTAEAPPGTRLGDRAETERRLTHSIPMYEICSGGKWVGRIKISAEAWNFHTLNAESPLLSVASEQRAAAGEGWMASADKRS